MPTLDFKMCNQNQPGKEGNDMKKGYDQSAIEASMNPLIITNHKEKLIQFYDIDSPFVITLETCREREGEYHIYQFSQNRYHPLCFQQNRSENCENRPLHQHSCIEFMYVLSGAVTNRVENQVFTYEAGQCCIMNKNIRHCEYFSGEFQVVFFMLRDDFIRELLTDYHEICNLKSDKNTETESLIFQLIADAETENLQFDKIYLDCFPMIPADDILEQLSRLFNFIIMETISWDFGSSFLIKGAFARLLQMLGDPQLFSINRIHSNARGQEYLFSKITHIMKSSHGRCTREELEKILHYNGEYLNRIVKKHTGKTILEYGQSIYLEEARQMLADTGESISSIIEELGFSNRSHFYRLFKKAYGETPQDYRKHLQK